MLRIAVALACLLPPAAPCRAELRIEPPPASVAQYDKLELVLHVDAEYLNPFDPGQVDLAVLIETPSQRRVRIPAFWYQPCQRRHLGGLGRRADWLYPAGDAVWICRFAPDEPGAYRATAELKDSRGTTTSSSVAFRSTASQCRGFVRRNARNGRFLQFDNGELFFPIGQNLAFIGPSQYFTLSKAIAAFSKLAENEANFVRIWTGCEDWALAIEAPRSAWSRSWEKRRPITEVPGASVKAIQIGGDSESRLTAAPYDGIPVRPGAEYVLSGVVEFRGASAVRASVGPSRESFDIPRGEAATQPFRHVFRAGAEQYYLDRITLARLGDGTAWLTALSLKETAGGPELLAGADPSLPRRGRYHAIDSAMLDELVEAAREKGVYLQLCITMRDLYMESLKDAGSGDYAAAIGDAKNLFRYCVARWGYSTSVAVWEYFNEMDPGLPTDRFYTELGEYLDKTDPYGHLRATSAWAPSPKDWRHARLDIAQEHFYLRPSNLEKLPDVVAAVADRAGHVRQVVSGKPILLAEFGLADEKWGFSPDMKVDEKLEHFHGALWASALSGVSGTAMFWWWDELDRRDAYVHYRPLARFLAGIPFAEENLQPAAAVVEGRAGLVAAGLQGPRHGYFWLYDRDGSWPRRSPAAEPVLVRGARLTLSGLEPGRYRAAWWDTRSGEPRGETTVEISAGGVVLDVPEFKLDVASKIEPADSRATRP